MLYLVPTPLGNLEDMSFRAIRILKGVSVILCEDTRTSTKLLDHYDIHVPLSPYHKFNEHKIVSHIVDQLAEGKEMAVITDAGTPAISDPGFLLVRECVTRGVEVCCLPGPTALIPALVNSGLPADRFVFEGFLPLKKGRNTRLEELSQESRTVIIYESPMRLARTLRDLMEKFGQDRLCSVSRELSKMFEENFHGTLQEAFDHFSQGKVKGEIVVVIEGLLRQSSKLINKISEL